MAWLIQRKEKRIVITCALGLGRAERISIHSRAIHGRNIRRGGDWLGNHSPLAASTLSLYVFRRQAMAAVDIQPGRSPRRTKRDRKNP